MDKHEGISTNREPRLDCLNYTFWRIRMEVYLQSLGVDVWKSIENGYDVPKTTPIEAAERRQKGYECNIVWCSRL